MTRAREGILRFDEVTFRNIYSTDDNAAVICEYEALLHRADLGGRYRAIHQTIRRRAEHAGYDATALSKLGGHLLRADFVTQGTRNGADGSAIARASTRRSSATWSLILGFEASMHG